MKKVIGIFMSMVFVVLMLSMAFGENPKNYSGSEVYTMVENWAESQHCYDLYNRNFKDGCYHMMGVIETRDFKELTGNDFSMEDLEKVYYNCDKYGYEWDVNECNVKLVGFHEGYDVYELTINTNTIPLGSCYDYETNNYVDYFNGKVLFMVCEN